MSGWEVLRDCGEPVGVKICLDQTCGQRWKGQKPFLPVRHQLCLSDTIMPDQRVPQAINSQIVLRKKRIKSAFQLPVSSFCCLVSGQSPSPGLAHSDGAEQLQPCKFWQELHTVGMCLRKGIFFPHIVGQLSPLLSFSFLGQFRGHTLACAQERKIQPGQSFEK